MPRTNPAGGLVSYLRGRPVSPGEAVEFGPGSGLDPAASSPREGRPLQARCGGTRCGGAGRKGDAVKEMVNLTGSFWVMEPNFLESSPRKIHLCHHILSTRGSLLKKYYWVVE